MINLKIREKHNQTIQQKVPEAGKTHFSLLNDRISTSILGE